MNHDRTPLGRHLLKMRDGLHKWIESHRDKVPESEIERAGYLACELYKSACDGSTIGARDNQANTRGKQP